MMNQVPEGMTKREYERMLWMCAIKGVPCEYGICDECPNASKTNINRSDKDGKERNNDCQ